MDPNIDCPEEREVLKKIYPNASPGRIRRLHGLCKKKKVIIKSGRPYADAINGMMISIVRHEATQYDVALQSGFCTKKSARGIFGPIIRNEMKRMKGE